MPRVSASYAKERRDMTKKIKEEKLKRKREKIAEDRKKRAAEEVVAEPIGQT